MNDEITDSPARQDRLNAILLEYVEACDHGTAPDRDRFIAAHAEFADDITEFLASYHKLNSLGAPLREASDAGRAAGGEPTTSPAPMAPFPAAELGQLGDYRLLREIGRGGMGVVYEAEQISLRRRVALKILPFAGGADARQLQRFRNEAEAAAHLHHTHIVPVFAVGSERGVHFYAMQYIEGQSLATLIADLSASQEMKPRSANAVKALGPASTQAAAALSTEHSTRSTHFFQRVAAIARQTAEALEYAHQMGVIHRDIKPANLLLDGRGDVWIADFGLAQFQSQAGLTISGELVGTLRYVSPEQAMAKRGLVDHHTDIYSLGATLYELLTLKPVFDGKDRHALLHQIGFEDPRPPRAIDASIPLELETIVLKALAKNPAERYGSAQEFADDLQRYLDDQPIQAKRPTLAERGRKWMRRHPSVVAATLFLLVFGLIASTISTVLIAGEQARTQKANDDLDTQVKQTKAAYDQLAVEEKRTKAANIELADQQVLTKTAYDAEERQRRLAEWDFAQSQRAIELVVQFSEGELAQQPDQQDVRRRLLLTVLDFYEDFLDQHADDPGVQAGREHVAKLVTQLSSLRGAALTAILRDTGVHADLKLSDEQKKRITPIVNVAGKQPPPKGKGPPPPSPRPMEAADIEKALGDILDGAQKKRFQQIVLQVQNQGRYAFSDPQLTEILKLTRRQRTRIREIQTQTHQAWADHVFTSKKIKKPPEFWADAQERVLGQLDAEQRLAWQKLAGAPVSVDFREGYPFDGRNVELPYPGPPPFDFREGWRGNIVVFQGRDDHTGSGFGHKAFVSARQCYAWRGKEIAPTVFEIAVTADPLSKEERKNIVNKGDRQPPAEKNADWLVLFRSADPRVWNTESPDKEKYAIPVAQAPRDVRYLRLTRMDTGEAQIIPIRHADLTQATKAGPDQDYLWNGAAHEAWGSVHLGIAETHPLRGPPPKGPKKGPGKGPPG